MPSVGYGTGYGSSGGTGAGYGGVVSGPGLSNTTLTTTLLRRLQVKPGADAANRSGDSSAF